MSEFIVIAGMSGAGRSRAADNLEDLGWFVMDNLPPSLVGKVAELAASPGGGAGADRLALVVGTGGYHDEITAMIADLRAELANLRLLFLDASTETLVRRYESSRRRHPFSGAGGAALAEAIEAERSALEPVRGAADVVIDTSDLNVHELRDRMTEMFARSGAEPAMRTTVMSFGYTHGIPRDADVVIDCRFLPNPHWVAELQPLDGRDARVARYLAGQPVTGEFYDRLGGLLRLMAPRYRAGGKSYLTVAFGCTGGRHRSVAVAEHVARMLAQDGLAPAVIHRDLAKGGAAAGDADQGGPVQAAAGGGAAGGGMAQADAAGGAAGGATGSGMAQAGAGGPVESAPTEEHVRS